MSKLFHKFRLYEICSIKIQLYVNSSQVVSIFLHSIQHVVNLIDVKILFPRKHQSKAICFLIAQRLEDVVTIEILVRIRQRVSSYCTMRPYIDLTWYSFVQPQFQRNRHIVQGKNLDFQLHMYCIVCRGLPTLNNQGLQTKANEDPFLNSSTKRCSSSTFWSTRAPNPLIVV